MENISQRIEIIARLSELSINEMERIIGASKGVLSRAIKNNTDIQSKWLLAIAENFPKFSPDWLLSGKGDPLRSYEPVIPDQDNNKATVIELVKIIREKDEQIIGMAQEIGQLKEQVAQLTQRLVKNADAADISRTAHVG